MTTEDKNSVVYEIGCSNCETVYFSESQQSQSLKLQLNEHKRSVKN